MNQKNPLSINPIDPADNTSDASSGPDITDSTTAQNADRSDAREFDAGKIYPGSQEHGLVSEVSPQVSKKPKRNFKKTKRLVYLALLAVMSITFFTRNDYRSVSSINDESKLAPKQTETKAKPFVYNFDGIGYEVTPLFEYELRGMVVSRLDYEKAFDAKNSADDKLFPTDLCMIWGENLTSGIYKSRSTSFSQGGRWCTWSWKEGVGIVNEAVANNHLMFTDPNVKKKIKNIKAGDQIKIIGKLVDVKTVTPNTPPEKIVSRHSSTVRTDTGGTSCEDILVEDIIVLQKNRNISQTLFIVSLIGSGLFTVMFLISWFLNLRR